MTYILLHLFELLINLQNSFRNNSNLTKNSSHLKLKTQFSRKLEEHGPYFSLIQPDYVEIFLTLQLVL